MFYTLISVVLVFFSMLQLGDAQVTIGYLIASGLFGIAGAITLSGSNRGLDE